MRAGTGRIRRSRLRRVAAAAAVTAVIGAGCASHDARGASSAPSNMTLRQSALATTRPATWIGHAFHAPSSAPRIPVPPPAACAEVRSPLWLGRPANVIARDGGASANVGGTELWAFSDTVFVPSEGSDSLRSATAAWAPPAAPTHVVDGGDASCIPTQFVPYTPAELAFNRAAASPNNRIALWTHSVIPLDDGSGLLVFGITHFKGDWNFEAMAQGLAIVRPGESQATRLPVQLFDAPSPFAATVSAMRDAGFIYLYACPTRRGYENLCEVARVPVTQFMIQSAYQYWNVDAWSSVPPSVATIPGSTAGMSVAWNPRLSEYVALIQPLGPDVEYRTAPAPQGPWSPPRRLFTERAPVTGFNYFIRQHPELSPDGGRTLVLTYSRPTMTGPCCEVDVATAQVEP